MRHPETMVEGFMGGWGGETPLQDVVFVYEAPDGERTTLASFWFQHDDMQVQVEYFRDADHNYYFRAWTVVGGVEFSCDTRETYNVFWMRGRDLRKESVDALVTKRA